MSNEIDATLLEFSRHQPLWQQDLFRRVLTQRSCTQSDLDEELLLLKAEMGIGPAGEPEPLCADHVPFREPSNTATILSAISDTKNVSRLMPNQELTFAAKGITLIYGDNGSGKSGYCRILRQLCRARRERSEQVLGDVYASIPPPPAQAKLFYSVDGELQEHLWVDGAPSPKELSRLTVFDAQAAPIYVDKQNQIDFLPEGLDVLPRVGSAIQSIGEMLDREISAHVSTTQGPILAVRAETSVGALVRRLETTSDDSLPAVEDIEQAGQWSTEDENALSSAREALMTLVEPVKVAAKYRRMHDALNKTAASILNALALLDDAAIENLSRMRKDARMAREAAKVAAVDAFKADPFATHINSEAWRNLFQYARQFSDVVYPAQPFPVVGANKLCVLCQQPLSESASARMIRFHAFLTETASRDADLKEQDLLVKLKAINELRIPSAVDAKSHLGEYTAMGPDEEALAAAAAQLCEVLRGRQTLLGQISINPDQQPGLVLPTTVEALTTAAKSLETRAWEYDQTAQNESQRTLYAKKRDELEARKLLNAELARVLERRELLEKLQKLRRCRSACDTAEVSRKATVLRDLHLSGSFKNRLSAEVETLGISYLPIRVASKSEYGASYRGIALEQTAGARTAAVLSEGENLGFLPSPVFWPKYTAFRATMASSSMTLFLRWIMATFGRWQGGL